MKSLLSRPEENISNRNGSQEKHNLQPLEILHLDAVEIGLVEGQLLQPLK
jgi:hypothetical protein